MDSLPNRRRFLQIGGALSVLVLPRIASGAGAESFSNAPSRSLSIYNLHTAEKLTTEYWIEGRYIPESLADINHILRDYRTGDVYDIHPDLLDTLCALRFQLETHEPFQLISGYRSPATNAMLRSHSDGVAQNSLHLKGMAADIRVPGRSLAVLRRAAISLKAGGVGYYPASQFVHVDVGRIRTW